eukprot:TRINITY_DN29461_c0_g1_i1.p1 TRINITY_DN29461_c0_g1~~TRINITY_DN29461_c0_g1_i1.p1  ORF type:complete len:302 (+),score=50.01 TRINITY_DN29461_c0_g1_i1:78-983(+)
MATSSLLVGDFTGLLFKTAEARKAGFFAASVHRPQGEETAIFFQHHVTSTPKLMAHFHSSKASQAWALKSTEGTVSATTEASTEIEEPVPLPVVVIDQHTEPNATVLELEFGDRLGALLDTVKALTELGLNVVRASVTTSANVGRNRFVLTQAGTGKKVEDPDTLEAIRLTVIANLLEYHPESSQQLMMSTMTGGIPKGGTQGLDSIETVVRVDNLPGEDHSVLTIETLDRPGLVLEIVKELNDLSINVVSAEIDTEGPVAKDQFYVSYHDAPLNSSMQEVLTNTLRYYLTRYDIEAEESY